MCPDPPPGGQVDRAIAQPSGSADNADDRTGAGVGVPALAPRVRARGGGGAVRGSGPQRSPSHSRRHQGEAGQVDAARSGRRPALYRLPQSSLRPSTALSRTPRLSRRPRSGQGQTTLTQVVS